MSMPSTIQVGRISSQPQAQFSIEFVSGLLGKASRVRALRSSAPQVRLSASADERPASAESNGLSADTEPGRARV